RDLSCLSLHDALPIYCTGTNPYSSFPFAANCVFGKYAVYVGFFYFNGKYIGENCKKIKQTSLKRSVKYCRFMSVLSADGYTDTQDRKSTRLNSSHVST